ncbi:MAG: Asp-tRNA(Asn)/Glu-tRNA(Gln) amidotransferase subunit GatC [Candidatus Kerfeldbacteria bacterium]|nr:Asp-tRNA(Asn)/Glu-tRNA(Gln) amidotransferase subunit GatC [Candidatus Kerfeldbacteria bacterium]
MDFNQALIEKLATLARMDLPPEQEKDFLVQLPKIVDYVSQLGNVATEPIVTEPPQAQSARADEAGSSQVKDEILAQAPERQEQFWRVPSVFSS